MENVEDIYRLSPMQEMMLMHSLAKADADLLFNQFCYEVRGELDLKAFGQAWQQIVNRHPVLRTAFLWDGLKQPLQVVRQQVELPFKVLDWRGQSEEEQQDALEAFRRADRELGFDPATAPLTRLAVIELTDDSFVLIWSSHHLLLDRWCISTIFSELFELYESNRQDRRPEMNGSYPYRDYIAWVQQQNLSQAKAFWTDTLKGFSQPTAITVSARTADEQALGAAQAQHKLSPETTEALRAFARKGGVTQGVLLQGAWALLLHHYTGRQDVVFGTTVSGRPPGLSGVDSILGSFINNLPVRVRLYGDDKLLDLLSAVQSAQQRRSAFEYVSLAAIQNWSDLPPPSRMFDTLLISLAPVALEPVSGLDIRGLPGELRTPYPFTLTIAEDEVLVLKAACDPSHRSVAPLSEILERLTSVLTSIAAAGPDARLADLEVCSGIADRSTAGALPTEGPGALQQIDDAQSDEADAPVSPKGREVVEEKVLEELLLNEWKHVLATDDIGLDDNFFEIGGDSLLAARLLAEIENTTRKVIPLLSLFQSPTVRQMAKTLMDEAWPLKPEILTPIRARGSKAPLFCIASPEVNAVGYAILGQHLDNDRPVYVLQAPPSVEEMIRVPVSEIPRMARDYVAAARKVQPTGPYNLLGMCSGAHLAVEMGKQLQESGESVAFIGLLDTWGVGSISRFYFVRSIANRLDYYAGRLREFCQLESSERNEVIRRVAKRRANSVRLAVLQAVKRERNAADPVRQGDDWIEVIGKMNTEEEFVKYKGAITLFSIGRKMYWRTRDPDMGWANQAETVQIEPLPAKDHTEILRHPHVMALVEKLENYLRAPKEEKDHDRAPTA